jgi:hypothetical protein
MAEQVSRPTSYAEMFPGRFLKAELFKGCEPTFEISDVTTEVFPGIGKDKKTGKKNPDQVKGLLNFVGQEKALMVNVTNGQCLRQIMAHLTDEQTSKDPQSLVGHKFTFFATTTPMRKWVDGKTITYQEPCIRVKGSPELGRNIQVEIDLGPMKKNFNMVMHATGPKTAPPAP